MMMLRLAWRNLILHRKKSALALLSIATAFCSLSLFEGYIRDLAGVYDDTFSRRQMLGDIIIEREGLLKEGKAGLDDDSLSLTEQEWIEQYLASHGVRNRVRFLNMGGIVASGQSSTIFIGLAYDPIEGAAMRAPNHTWNVSSGQPLESKPEQAVALLGLGLADVMGCSWPDSRPGQVTEFDCPSPVVQLQVNTEAGQANAMDFEILGVTAFGFAEIDARLVMLPLAEAASLFDTNLVSYYSLSLEERDLASSWVTDFNASAQQAGLQLIARRWQDHKFGEIYLQSMDFLNVFKAFVNTIVLFVAAMAVMNTFIKIVNERLRELGTLRSIGYQPYHILSIFSMEAAFLALLGSAFGIALSLLGAFVGNAANIYYNAGLLTEGIPFRIELANSDFVWITGLLVSLALISTILPVWRASYQKIAVLLADH